MPSPPLISLLIVDDDPTSLDLTCATLEQEGLEILSTSDPHQALRQITERRPPIVITDLMMPEITGMQVLAHALQADPATEVVLLTAHYSAEAAVAAVQQGASDYINKPLDTRQFRARIGEIIARIRKRRQARRLEVELLEASRFRGMIGHSPAMLDVFARIERIAPHYRTVLITGPTGAGKELAGRALHDASPAASGPFVVCNCAAIPENLVESELFGHVRGAFTGAHQDKSGLFEAAHGGTIMLDELGEMPMAAQAKLLRAVQQQELQRVGANTVRKVNVRVIAATHRDLRGMVAARTFREDLYFRVGMVELTLPALRDRRDDIPLFLRFFLDRYAGLYGKPFQGFTRKAEDALQQYPWPGNVRELEGMIASVAMMADPPWIDFADLPPQIRFPAAGAEDCDGDLTLSLEKLQVVHAHRVLRSLNGDKSRAADVLGVSRATLYRLLAKTPERI